MIHINYLNYFAEDRKTENLEQDQILQKKFTSHGDDIQVDSTKKRLTIPTTIDGLIKYIAENGDHWEEVIVDEIAQMNERTLFR